MHKLTKKEDEVRTVIKEEALSEFVNILNYKTNVVKIDRFGLIKKNSG